MHNSSPTLPTPGPIGGAQRVRGGPWSTALAGLVVCLFGCTLRATPPPRSAPASEMLRASLAVGDKLWDDPRALLWSVAKNAPARAHGIRASAWYALGLMLRDEPGDLERSRRAIRAICERQIDQPDAPWDGTFYRTAEDPPLRPGAKMWQDYDPNWREFIGTTFALLLHEFPDRIAAPERARLLDAIRRAVEGELKQQRLQPTYTNIALMHGFLWADAGRQLGRDAWVRDAEAWMNAIAARFAPHQSFDEFNSPTYYGVDLYGLALLRQFGATPRLRELGATMEAALWRDIAQFYHAGLRNLAGPFDRAYGMDMRRYVSLVGEWLALALPREQAPFPAPGAPMAHAGDFLCTPTYVLLGPAIPADALPHFLKFQGERQITRPIADGRRTATAWLGRDLAIGAEATGGTRGVPSATAQFHPATIHWRLPDGDLGWIALRECPPVDAVASKNELTIKTAATGDVVFLVAAAGASPQTLTRDTWELPGLRAGVTTDAQACSAVKTPHGIELTYRNAGSIVLHLRNQPEP